MFDKLVPFKCVIASESFSADMDSIKSSLFCFGEEGNFVDDRGSAIPFAIRHSRKFAIILSAFNDNYLSRRDFLPLP